MTDMIQAQRDLEKDMRTLSISRFYRLHDNAEKRGDFAETSTGRAVQFHVEQAVLDGINAFIELSSNGTAGAKHRAVKMLTCMEPETFAFITTKAIINKVPLRNGSDSKATSVQHVAYDIAGRLHDELAIRYFEANNKKLIRKLMKDFDERDLNRDRRKALIQRTMSKLRLEWQQEGWDQTSRLHLGIKLLDIFVERTGILKIDDVGVKTQQQRKVITPTPEFIEVVKARMDNNEANYSMYLPMVCPPKDWTQDNLFGGGYLTSNVTPYPLAKDTNRAYLEELQNSDLTDVLAAINAIQRTGWRVNDDMLRLVKWAYASNHGDRCGLPDASPREIPPMPAAAKTDKNVSNEYRRDCYLVHDHNRRSVSKRIAALQAFQIADKMAEYPEHFYPHFMDSRGRLYPKPVVLNPQSTDYIKHICEYSVGKPVTSDSAGMRWLMIACANAYGMDKLTLDERIQWCLDNNELIMSVAENPMTDIRWMDAGEPFAFARAAKELYGVLLAEANGEVFMSHMPVPVDATCSGIQHYSAMLLDPVGSKATNLDNLTERQDIYQQVADRVVEKLEKLIVSGGDPKDIAMAEAALKAGVTRKLCKKSVMVVPYSATFHACMRYTNTHYAEQHQEPWKPMGEFVPFISRVLWQSIDEVVVAAREAMKWLTDMASLTVKSGTQSPMTWTTPAGFPVRQIRLETSPVRVKTFLDGKRCDISYIKNKATLDGGKMRSSIAPNFVHSLDAAHLQLTISACLNAYDAGEVSTPMSFCMIHDSFAVHASDMDVFSVLLRHSFHYIYTKHDPLKEFLEENRLVLKDEDIPDLPIKGDFNIDNVLESSFFFS